MIVRRFCPGFLLALAFAPRLLAQVGYPLFSTDFPPEEFAKRRAAVYDAIGSKAVAILQGAPTPDGYTRFRQSNDFYYLSGVEVPNAYLLLDPIERKTTLYLPHRNERREVGEGKVLSVEDLESVEKASGLDAVFGPELLGEHLARLLQRRAPLTVYTPLFPPEGGAESRDLALRRIAELASDPFDGSASREGRFAARMRERRGVEVHASGADDGIVLRLPDSVDDMGAEVVPTAEAHRIRHERRLRALGVVPVQEVPLVPLQPFDGRHVTAVRLHPEHRAGLHREAVEEHDLRRPGAVRLHGLLSGAGPGRWPGTRRWWSGPGPPCSASSLIIASKPRLAAPCIAVNPCELTALTSLPCSQQIFAASSNAAASVGRSFGSTSSSRWSSRK